MSLSGFARCSAIAALALLAGGAFAQPLKEVVADEEIRLQPGQGRMFEFGEPVDTIGTAVDGIVRIVPSTDRTFTFQAISSGKVLAEAFAKDGHVIKRMMIVVEGGPVRVQRWPAGDATSYICTDIGGCDPADLNAPMAPEQVPEPQRNDGSGNTNP
jgi:hypothetical protein